MRAICFIDFGISASFGAVKNSPLYRAHGSDGTRDAERDGVYGIEQLGAICVFDVP
jgi:hypothetical protein